MPIWTARLFGQEELTCSGVGAVPLPDVWWPVFGCLLSAPRWHLSRGKLAGMLWPDRTEKAARHCLATALWRIKARLPSDQQLIRVDSESVGLSLRGSLWVDLIAFQRRVAQSLAQPEILASRRERVRLRRALSLYRGHFMADRDLEWVAIERERLRTQFLDAMFALANAEVAAGRWTKARDSARRICEIEPLREDAQRLLMAAHVECGSRAVALDQYRVLKELLRTELNVAPMPETRRLAADIAGSNPPSSDPLPGPIQGLPFDRTEAIAQVQDHLQRSLELLNHCLGA